MATPSPQNTLTPYLLDMTTPVRKLKVVGGKLQAT